MDSTDDRTPIAPLFWLALGLAGLAAAAAIFSGRDLVYDGSYYLLGIAAQGRFHLIEPARLAPQWLQQCFAVAGARLGVRDLWTLGRLFSLGASGWPIVLTALCWFALPRGQKRWIAGPLLNLVFAIPATNFIGVGEGVIGSCLLWLAFLLIEFRSASVVGAVAGVAVTAGCAFTHEAAILCLLVIALAAAFQLSDARGLRRAALFVAAAIALAGAANMARWILFPRSAIERGDFIASMGGFLGWPTDPNLPAAMSVVAAVAILVLLIGKGERARTSVAVAVTLILALFVVLLVGADRVIAPSRYFAARGMPVGLTTLLTAFFLLLRRRGETPDRFATPPVLAIVLTLAIVQPATQAFITLRWVSYADALRELVSTESGVVPHALAMQRLDPGNARFRRELLESWSVEPFALVLVPGGRVRAFVEAGSKERWTPYDPHKPAKLPRPPGLDWSHFIPEPAR